MTAPADNAARARLVGMTEPTDGSREPGAPAWTPRGRPLAAEAALDAPARPVRAAQGEAPAWPGAERSEDPEDGSWLLEDASDVAARWRQGALARVGELYADAHGTPLDHVARDRPRRRWAVSLRLAVTASVALALLGGGVAVRALSASGGAEFAAELPEAAAPGRSGAQDAGADSGARSSTAVAGDDSPSPGGVPGGGAAARTGAAPEEGGSSVVVHVVGEVLAPGLVELPAGARVADALTAAGGATSAADLAAVNLARHLVDGEQVLVPLPGQEVPAPLGAAQGGGGGPGPASALVDVNTADSAALDALPGIGPVLAERIVTWRQENGRFTSVDELGEVSGIGPTLLGRLRALVRV
ncbi:ComEA family DNA-binding protein [Cellulomonas chengniuliangii]|uniref:ComEA family DNA-binding protein n=1 Tax=Cellulomonas chengniuliangii TaxID=2968084 RepID=A0ABY5L3C6_9CELL|nr:ComEA family DNA-binding protein [Cellulomonas chengniuliangii]MCC2308009.1 ComEA family DNA-binding protein [Cellulomonas chengniuliangii]UUI76410.1 ComEA family DNA-binding protein [Cellulomonas chengniuliangii]